MFVQAIDILMNFFNIFCVGCMCVWPFCKMVGDFEDKFAAGALLALLFKEVIAQAIGYLAAVIFMLFTIIVPLIILDIYLFKKAIWPEVKFF